MKATFIGPTPKILRELSIENARKVFIYNKPILIMFRNTSVEESRYYEKQIVEANP